MKILVFYLLLSICSSSNLFFPSPIQSEIPKMESCSLYDEIGEESDEPLEPEDPYIIYDFDESSGFSYAVSTSLSIQTQGLYNDLGTMALAFSIATGHYYYNAGIPGFGCNIFTATTRDLCGLLEELSS